MFPHTVSTFEREFTFVHSDTEVYYAIDVDQIKGTAMS